MDYLKKLIVDIELHSKEGIELCFQNGISPNDLYENKPLIFELISEYPRGPKFKECVRAFVNYGLLFEDEALLAVLMDDAEFLKALLNSDPGYINKKYSFKCAFTPVFEASLLHICAEYNHVACADVLVKYGADVNARAGIDENGFGGQTPIFHTVNQHSDKCIDMMNFLLSEPADLRFTVKGLVWGKGYKWETFIPAVNPISYAMMGLLPQFQRAEIQIYEVVSRLMSAAFEVDYFPQNIPNAYLRT